MSNKCDYGYGYCTAPDTICPHWQGTFCELYYGMFGKTFIRLRFGWSRTYRRGCRCS